MPPQPVLMRLLTCWPKTGEPLAILSIVLLSSKKLEENFQTMEQDWISGDRRVEEKTTHYSHSEGRTGTRFP